MKLNFKLTPNQILTVVAALFVVTLAINYVPGAYQLRQYLFPA